MKVARDQLLPRILVFLHRLLRLLLPFLLLVFHLQAQLLPRFRRFFLIEVAAGVDGQRRQQYKYTILTYT